ncbi:SufB/SufD family protein [Glacieibacterium frigidum]|uniref:SufD family Fe-S cluster assembly protein n=1 Tax=Glacieibacterium frigidum TaxID=2593303 RepID=A0A552UG94_9SPHN|nr:SufD family Fe-S cluster assembly protein [Glacieibacterium frigidum]TRW17248.1 SufD family Fe-S cluster assembly protein [Glacieibacterium frigidum]
MSLPTRKTEDWRWSDLSGLDALAAQPANDAAPDLAHYWLDLDGPRLVFVDGRFVESLSDRRGLAVTAVRSAPRHPLGDIAAAKATSGLWLTRSANAAAIGPVQIVHVASGGASHLASRIELAAGAHAEIIETHVGAGWSNVTCTVALAEGARLMRTTRVLKDGGAHTDFTLATVAGAASYTSAALVAGADSARIEARVRLQGTGAFAEADGVLLARGTQTLDAFTLVDHAAPGGTSHQVWRSVADDLATASVAGRVSVARDAQKTDAVQSLKALLLARTATANAKPELEIWADDVKCAHGATVGELNRDALFYLQSRGVDPAGAKALLTRAFLGDALDRIGDEVVRDAVTADAVAWLEAAR